MGQYNKPFVSDIIETPLPPLDRTDPYSIPLIMQNVDLARTYYEQCAKIASDISKVVIDVSKVETLAAETEINAREAGIDRARCDFIYNEVKDVDLTEYAKKSWVIDYVDEHGGVQIDDDTISASKVWSSFKVSTELASYVLSEDVSEVAYSGDYDDLNNTPDLTVYATTTYVDSKIGDIETALEALIGE